MDADLRYDYRVVTFTDEDTWRTDADGETEYTKRLNKEGDDSWELTSIVREPGSVSFTAVLRRDAEYFRKGL